MIGNFKFRVPRGMRLFTSRVGGPNRAPHLELTFRAKSGKFHTFSASSVSYSPSSGKLGLRDPEGYTLPNFPEWKDRK